METSKSIILLCSLFLILLSCRKEERDILNYKIYNESNLIGFEKLKISREGNMRIDSTFRYSKDMVIQDTTVAGYSINKKGLFTGNDNYYINISADSCYNYKSQMSENFQICFKGTENITIEGKNYPKAYKFLVTETFGKYSSHPLKTRKYFDKNFVLLRNELVEGYRRYFRVDRVDK